MPHCRTRPSPVVGALLAALAAVIVTGGTASADRKLSLDQAVDLALKQNQTLQVEQAKVEQAEATRKSTRGLYGPSLALEGNVMVWDSALPFTFDMPDTATFMKTIANAGLTADEIATVMTLGKVMPLLLDVGNIRDQVTGQISVTLAQPLTPLLQIHKAYGASSAMAKAAALDAGAVRLDVIRDVTTTYLRLMQTSQFEAIARTGVEQVEAHVKQAETFRRAGLIGKQEVLKAQVELARAKQRVLQAKTGRNMAASGLALLLGIPATEDVRPTEQVADPPKPSTLTLDQAIKRAMANSKKVKAIKYKGEAAEAGADAEKWGAYLPQLSLAASYQHTEGQGTLMPKDAFFAGAFLNWDLWKWGHDHYKVAAARAQAKQAQKGGELLRNAVVLQAKQAFLNLRTAEQAMSVARVAITEAEETFRIEKKRFEAHTATTTDVLDAQLALTRGKLTYSNALYSYYIAHAELRRAMGQK